MSERVVQRAGPEEVFGSLSNDIRVAVIRALRDAEGHEAAFSDLRETVGSTFMSDPSGSFRRSTTSGWRFATRNRSERA